MIRKLALFLIVLVFSMDFLAKSKFVPSKITWSFELISAAVLVMILLGAAKRRFMFTGAPYWILGAMLLGHLAVGVVANDVPTGVVFAGLRIYLKYVPFFFLPMLFDLNEKDLLKHFRLLVGLTLIQFPIVLYQRFILSGDLATGDKVSGTLMVSSMLSIFLICFASILIAIYLRGLLKRKQFAVLLIITLLPTMMNETKGTLILLPFAIMTPVLLNSRDPYRLQRLLSMSLIGMLFLVLYIPIYDHFRSGGAGSVVNYFTDIDKLQKHLFPKATGLDEEKSGRLDPLVIPWQTLSSDPFKLLVGLGIGNASDSALGEKFTGSYYGVYGGTYLALAHLMWEIGLLGVLLILAFWGLIFRDALRLRSHPGISGAFALGWLGVVIVLAISLAYKNIIHHSALAYMFWFYSGWLASLRNRYEAHRHPTFRQLGSSDGKKDFSRDFGQ